MKKIVLFVVCCFLIAVPSLAGNIDFSGRAGLYTAPGGIGTSTMYGVSASQGITENLSVRLLMETTTYSVAGSSTTFTPISLDLIYSQVLPGGIRPYAGAGVSYNSMSVGGGAATSSTGAQTEVGVAYSFGGLTAGLEYRLMIPDLTNASSTATAFNGYATGSVGHSIRF